MQRRKISSPKPETLVRPIVRKLHAYTPGEQPKKAGLVKLNTNENPYGPAPEVLAAIKEAVHAGLRLYPNPTADSLRIKLARKHGCTSENIIVGNGSDELLALATRAFVEPLTGLTHYALQSATRGISARSQDQPSAKVSRQVQRGLVASRYAVQFLHPSYSLYPVLAAMHGAWRKPVPLQKDFALPPLPQLKEDGWDARAALTFVTTPNAPSGRGYSRDELEQLCAAHRGVLILDEAYVDFADENALDLSLIYPHVLVARTFSKAYSLCALRVGYLVGHPELISALHKVRDSYNVNGLGQVAAEATLDALPYYQNNFKRIRRSREYLGAQLGELGFRVFPSQTNFVLVVPPRWPAENWLQQLREENILVRWFNSPEVRSYLRITIGSEAEVEALIAAAKRILARRT
jgi:histidinol-phosphate aminotransferase